MSLPSIAPSDYLTLIRAGLATVINDLGQRADVAANTLRHDFSAAGVPAGFRFEGPDTNLIPNPLFNGAVAGTPGAAPTGSNTSGFTGTQSGISASVVSVGLVGGDMRIAVRYQGTASGTAVNAIFANGTMPFLTARAQYHAIDVTMIAGTKANVTNITLSGGAGATTIGPSGIFGLGATRTTLTMTKPAGTGTDANGNLFVGLTVTNGGAVDITLEYSVFLAYRASAAAPTVTRPIQSLIRPAPAGSGPVSRARDDARFARIDWWNPARAVSSTVVGSGCVHEFLIPATSPEVMGLLRVDDATASNRQETYIPVGTTQVWHRRVIAGSEVFNAQIGSFTAGSPFRVLWSGVGSAHHVMVTGGDLTPVTHGAAFAAAGGFLGSITADDTTPLWGWFRGSLYYERGLTGTAALDATNTSISLETLRLEGLA